MASSRHSASGVAYINGRVYTMCETSLWAEAFIVDAEGRFAAVGTNHDVQSQAQRQNLAVFDLAGRFCMPGIHDAHAHALTSGLAAICQIKLPETGLDINNVADEIRKGSCQCQYSNVHQDWLIAHAYMVPGFDRSSLDEAYPNTPVVIHGGAGHSALLNTEALRRSGYDPQHEPDGQATFIARREDGSLTGELAEMALSKALLRVPRPELAIAKLGLLEAQRKLHRAGVTSFQEASANTLILQALAELEREKALKLSIATHIVYAPDWIAEEESESLHRLIDDAERYKSEHVDTRFVKIILDGVPLPPYYSQADLMSDGAADETKLFLQPDALGAAVRAYDARGMTIKTHCTGRGATRLTLDAYAAAREANAHQGKGPRHEIAHCNGIADEDLHRFAELDVTAEHSPAFLFAHPLAAASDGLMNWDFARALGAGAHVTVGSDWNNAADPDLLPCLAPIVRAVGGGDKGLGGERLCRMLTLDGAVAVGGQREVGSIEVGKKANFITVDKALSAGDFDGAHVTATWFEGDLVYERS